MDKVMKYVIWIALLLTGVSGFCSETKESDSRATWTLVEGKETIAWKKQFERAAKKDQLYEEMKKIGIFSTRGPFFFRGPNNNVVRAFIYIGFVGRYEVELSLGPKPTVVKTLFRDGASGDQFDQFRPMYDAFSKHLLKLLSDPEDAPANDKPDAVDHAPSDSWSEGGKKQKSESPE